MAMPIFRYHLARGAVGEAPLAVRLAMIAPGAVTAGTNIPLPSYAIPARRILDAIIIKTATASAIHAACAASGAAYPSDTNLLSPVGEAVVAEAKKLTVVTTTPTAGQIRLVDLNNIVLGEDTAADDILLVIVELR